MQALMTDCWKAASGEEDVGCVHTWYTKMWYTKLPGEGVSFNSSSGRGRCEVLRERHQPNAAADEGSFRKCGELSWRVRRVWAEFK